MLAMVVGRLGWPVTRPLLGQTSFLGLPSSRWATSLARHSASFMPCYAEFASTVPVAGSAYTYSYATFGELLAWIIGWDLILEFAVAAAAVAKGWSV
jgi:amino acid transporter